MRPRSALFAAVCLTTVAVSACGNTSEGEPVAEKESTAESTSSATTSTASTSTRAIPTPESDLTEPGVVPTTRTAVPAGTVTCELSEPAGDGVATAAVSDPAAPKITIALPPGWASAPGDGDIGAKLTGPEGISATITIAKTTLDPTAAFKKYSDDAMAASPVSSVSVLPADLCGYSGQKLLGSWSDAPGQAVEYGDRVAHIWTNNGDYLVAVHVQGLADSPGFDPFTSPIMDDFGIEIP